MNIYGIFLFKYFFVIMQRLLYIERHTKIYNFHVGLAFKTNSLNLYFAIYIAIDAAKKYERLLFLHAKHRYVCIQ